MKNTTAKKFKYGSLSVVITVVFIALIIGVNLIVSSLDASFNLRVDLTETELYSISPETDVALRAGLGDNYETFKVTIKFLDERDVIESKSDGALCPAACGGIRAPVSEQHQRRVYRYHQKSQRGREISQ